MEGQGPLIGRIILIFNVIVGAIICLIMVGIFMVINALLLWISWIVLAAGSLFLLPFPKFNRKIGTFLRSYRQWIIHEGSNFSDLG